MYLSSMSNVRSFRSSLMGLGQKFVLVVPKRPTIGSPEDYIQMPREERFESPNRIQRHPGLERSIELSSPPRHRSSPCPENHHDTSSPINPDTIFSLNHWSEFRGPLHFEQASIASKLPYRQPLRRVFLLGIGATGILTIVFVFLTHSLRFLAIHPSSRPSLTEQRPDTTFAQFNSFQNIESSAAQSSISPESGYSRSPPELVDARYSWPDRPPFPAIAPFSIQQALAYQKAWADHLDLPMEIENTVGMKFRLIPPDEFDMGADPDEIRTNWLPNRPQPEKEVLSESPKHRVVLTQPFYLGIHEVTRKQYRVVTNLLERPTPSETESTSRDFVTDSSQGDHPVNDLSWDEAIRFCKQLSEREHLDPCSRSAGRDHLLKVCGYRLPTEAEWEFSCRAGTTGWYWTGGVGSQLDGIAWTNTNSGKQSHPVGQLAPNPFGLYDVIGNVWEWTRDGWDSAYYSQFQSQLAVDPQGPEIIGMNVVGRGGSWYNNHYYVRASYRAEFNRFQRSRDIGFRVAFSINGARGILDSKLPNR